MNGSVRCVASNEISTEWSDPLQKDCRGRVSAVIVVTVSIFLLSVFLLFSLKKRRSRRSNIEASLEDNIYVTMHGNKRKERGWGDQDTESPYVCGTPVSMTTPIPKQRFEDIEDIYV
ncbi:uncharacterized protein ACJ7VT_006512 [Polymixia lowei]